MKSGFEIVYLMHEWECFMIEIYGKDVTDLFYRSQSNGSQELFSKLLDELMANKEIEYEELKRIALQNLDCSDPFGIEIGENHIRKFMRIYNKNEIELAENLRILGDCRMLKERFGLNFDGEWDELEGYPIRDRIVGDRVGILDKSHGNHLEYHFFDGENVIAKSFSIDSTVIGLDDSIFNGKILGFIQICIKDTATDLGEINNEVLKMFLMKNLKKVKLPTERFLMRNGTTKFHALPDEEIADMTKNLQGAMILDDFTQIMKAFMIIPVWKTKAIKDGLVQFEIGFRLHVGPGKKMEEDFRFFI